MNEKTKRGSIDFNGDMNDILYAMSEGNPGGLRVLMELIYTDPTLIVTLDDMNIRGSQIWVGYKDHCHQKLEAFIKCIRERDAAMIATINREFAKYPPTEFRPKSVQAVGHGEREEIQ